MIAPGKPYKAKPLIDRYGRSISYLRVSVTDHCNLRCTYCMPPEGLEEFDREDILTYDEIVRVVEVGAELGVRKVRITGGEPLVRHGLADLIGRIATIPKIEHLCMTSNGVHLQKHASELFDAGLQSINISIDSLNENRYRNATRGGDLKTVLKGINAALECGFSLKFNAVALRDLTHDEAFDFIDLAMTLGVEMRFIEFMPLCGTAWKPLEYTPLSELEDAIVAKYDLGDSTREPVARTYNLPRAGAKVGFITSMSQPFCNQCSRIRLTADGHLRPCLFSQEQVDVRSVLRSTTSNVPIAQAYRQIIERKPAGHGFSRHDIEMGNVDTGCTIRNVGG